MRPVALVDTWYHVFRGRSRGFSEVRELKPCLSMVTVVVGREETTSGKGTL